MIRTQIYLSEADKKMLAQLSAITGHTVSDLIREAIAAFAPKKLSAEEKRKNSQLKALKRAFGGWKNNTVDFEEIRRSADREFK